MRGQQYRRLLHSARSASRLRPADAITLDTEFHKRDVLALDGAPVQSTSGMESEHLVDKPSNRAGFSLKNLQDRLDHAHPCSAKRSRRRCSGSLTIRVSFALANQNEVSFGPAMKVRAK